MTAFDDALAYDLLMGRWSRLLANEFVAFIGIGDGDRVLDVGCGTGSLAEAVLAASGKTEVVGVDPSTTFVEFARNRLGARARFETGDAQQLRFGDAAFDCAAAMIVINFVPDPRRAVAEMRRITRAGGRAAACVWDYGGEMAMLRRFWDAAVEMNPEAAPRHEKQMPLCRAGELGELWRETGFQDVREGGLVIETRFASFEDFWKPFLAGVGPSGAYVASLPSGERQKLERKLRAEVWNDRPGDPMSLPARAWAAAGTVH